MSTTGRERWTTKSAYCVMCGHDWQAVYDELATARLECPNCHQIVPILAVPEA